LEKKRIKIWKNNPTQPCAPIIFQYNMKLLKTPNSFITPPIFRMQFLKIETTTHGYVNTANIYLDGKHKNK
jgi:hypothetical protein